MTSRTVKLLALGLGSLIAAAAITLVSGTGAAWSIDGSGAVQARQRGSEMDVLMAASGADLRIRTAQVQGLASFDRYVENKVHDLPTYSGQEESQRQALIRDFREGQRKLREQITTHAASGQLRSELGEKFDSREIAEIVQFLTTPAGLKMAKNMELFTVRPTSLVQQYEYQLAPQSYEMSDQLTKEVKMLKLDRRGNPNVGS
jgi:hypothetical protein